MHRSLYLNNILVEYETNDTIVAHIYLSVRTSNYCRPPNALKYDYGFKAPYCNVHIKVPYHNSHPNVLYCNVCSHATMLNTNSTTWFNILNLINS